MHRMLKYYFLVLEKKKETLDFHLSCQWIIPLCVEQSYDYVGMFLRRDM